MLLLAVFRGERDVHYLSNSLRISILFKTLLKLEDALSGDVHPEAMIL